MSRTSGKVSGLVSFLSLMSGGSLVLFGGGSLLISGFAGALAGALVGLALLGHGFFELKQRKLFLGDPSVGVARKLAWNQGALAGSVILYLGWQARSIDRAVISAMLNRDPLESLLAQMPPGTAEQINAELPRLLVAFYSLAALLVLAGCLGMAFMYLRSAAETER
ncbi:hypothetical protein VDG1235_2301 [Verrucomicrobiia bacterium DG1235]|nr:hypothetical protein VDG1235_2301 [Verrucomicrobiae bacterium DG1235]